MIETKQSNSSSKQVRKSESEEDAGKERSRTEAYRGDVVENRESDGNRKRLMGEKIRNISKTVQKNYKEGLYNLLQAFQEIDTLDDDQYNSNQEAFSYKSQISQQNSLQNKKITSEELTLKMVNKTIEGVNNLIGAMQVKEHYSYSYLFKSVLDKNQEGLENFSKAFSELAIEEAEECEEGKINENAKDINEKQREQRWENQNQFLNDDSQKKQNQVGNITDKNFQPEQLQTKNKKISRQGSSHSQRNKSADKRSEISEQFNLDLTMKSKNHLYTSTKQEELMYSANSQNIFQSQTQISQKIHKKETILEMEDKMENEDAGNNNKSQLSKFNEKQSSKNEEGNEYQIERQIDFEENKYSNIEFMTPIKKEERQRKNEDTIIPESLSNFNVNDEGQEEEEQMDEDQEKLMASADLRNYRQSYNKNLSKKRVETQVYEKKTQNIHKKRFQRINPHSSKSKLHTQSNSNIFSTQISNYQSRLAKIREAKELKKKKLELELSKINNEIKALKNKEGEVSPKNGNGFASRLDISNDNEAQRRAEKLVKNLRSQKRSRNNAKIGEIRNLDRNINNYMDELHRLRAENEDKYKQKKKLEILERMKQNQMRKINERKKKEESQNFVLHLRQGLKPQHKNTLPPSNLPSKRSPTRNLQTQQIQQLSEFGMTPQLTQKKAYLNKIRSFSRKKQSKDLYEQALS